MTDSTFDNLKYRVEELEKNLKEETNNVKEDENIENQIFDSEDYVAAVQELEARLSEAENEILKYREEEFHLTEKIYELEQEKREIQIENQKLTRFKPHIEDFEEENLNDYPTYDELLHQAEDLLKYQHEIEELTEIKENAIETLLEKDKEILELQERLEELMKIGQTPKGKDILQENSEEYDKLEEAINKRVNLRMEEYLREFQEREDHCKEVEEKLVVDEKKIRELQEKIESNERKYDESIDYYKNLVDTTHYSEIDKRINERVEAEKKKMSEYYQIKIKELEDLSHRQLTTTKEDFKDVVTEKFSFMSKLSKVEGQVEARENMIMLLKKRIEELENILYEKEKEKEKIIEEYDEKINENNIKFARERKILEKQIADLKEEKILMSNPRKSIMISHNLFGEINNLFENEFVGFVGLINVGVKFKGKDIVEWITFFKGKFMISRYGTEITNAFYTLGIKENKVVIYTVRYDNYLPRKIGTAVCPVEIGHKTICDKDIAVYTVDYELAGELRQLDLGKKEEIIELLTTAMKINNNNKGKTVFGLKNFTQM